jgi:hypothetical protein
MIEKLYDLTAPPPREEGLGEVVEENYYSHSFD